jgi:hypothetical protein
MGVPLEELVSPIEIAVLMIQVQSIAMENMGESNSYPAADYPFERACRKSLVHTENGAY